jgi:hypothetical protein
MFQGVTNPGCSRFGMTESFVPFQPNVNPDGSLNPNAWLDKSIFFGATMPDPGGLPLGSLLYETFSKFFNVAGDSFQVTVHTKSGSGTAWAQQMTRYLASVGKTPADLYYAQVWDPSGALGLDAGVFQATGVSAASLRKAIINSSRPDSPGLQVSDASLSGKHVTVVVNGASGTTLYLYDHRDDVFYTGGSARAWRRNSLVSCPERSRPVRRFSAHPPRDDHRSGPARAAACRPRVR